MTFGTIRTKPLPPEWLVVYVRLEESGKMGHPCRVVELSLNQSDSKPKEFWLLAYLEQLDTFQLQFIIDLRQVPRLRLRLGHVLCWTEKVKLPDQLLGSLELATASAIVAGNYRIQQDRYYLHQILNIKE